MPKSMVLLAGLEHLALCHRLAQVVKELDPHSRSAPMAVVITRLLILIQVAKAMWLMI